MSGLLYFWCVWGLLFNSPFILKHSSISLIYRFDTFKSMHEMWKGYMNQLLQITGWDIILIFFYSGSSVMWMWRHQHILLYMHFKCFFFQCYNHSSLNCRKNQLAQCLLGADLHGALILGSAILISWAILHIISAPFMCLWWYKFIRLFPLEATFSYVNI